jgi:hypothetical protein
MDPMKILTTKRRGCQKISKVRPIKKKRSSRKSKKSPEEKSLRERKGADLLGKMFFGMCPWGRVVQGFMRSFS